jgi:hypothetical protein
MFLEDVARSADSARRQLPQYGTMRGGRIPPGSGRGGRGGGRGGHGSAAAGDGAEVYGLAKLPAHVHLLLKHVSGIVTAATLQFNDRRRLTSSAAATRASPNSCARYSPQARERGVNLRIMPKGMQRHDSNTSKWLSTPKTRKSIPTADHAIGEVSAAHEDEMGAATANVAGSDVEPSPKRARHDARCENAGDGAAASTPACSASAARSGTLFWRVEYEFPHADPPFTATHDAVNETTLVHDAVAGFFKRKAGATSEAMNAPMRHRLRGYFGENAFVSDVPAYSVFLLHPYAVQGVMRYHRVPSTATFADVLQGKTLVEFPTIRIVPDGLSAGVPLLELQLVSAPRPSNDA